jgi:hypothetical protein
MSTPAAPALKLATDKPRYAPGEEITLTAELVAPAQNTITVSATDPATGNVVTGEVTVLVDEPVTADVQFGVSDSRGDQFVQQSAGGGSAVLTTTVGPAPAA